MDFEQENIGRIAAYIKNGEKKRGEEKLGVEIEHFIVDKQTLKSIGYHGIPGAFNLLERLSPLYEQQAFVDGALLGLKREGSYITLEPAAQLELSIETKASIVDIKNVYARFYKELVAELEKDGCMLVNLGYHPASRIEHLEMIPKKRYEHMAAHMSQKGRYAKNMMKGTASVQVSIDYFSEKDFNRKFRAANCLSAVLAFMTDNVPVFEGNPNSQTMIRTQIWNEVDPVRCGIAANALTDPYFGYHNYAEYIYSRPALMTLKNGELTYTADQTLSEIFSDKFMENDEIEYALGMFFPDVRAKTYIEIRMADSMPQNYMLAYAALIKGIFYNEQNLDAVLRLYDGFDDAAENALKQLLIQKGPEAVLFGKNIYDHCADLVRMAQEALPEERTYLDPLAELMRLRCKVFETDPIFAFHFPNNKRKSI